MGKVPKTRAMSRLSKEEGEPQTPQPLQAPAAASSECKVFQGLGGSTQLSGSTLQ